VLCDYAWLRDRSRRLVGRACWFLSHGPKFLLLKPIPAVETRYDSHQEWLEHAQKAYGTGLGRRRELLRNTPSR